MKCNSIRRTNGVFVKFNERVCGFTAGFRAQNKAAEKPSPAVGTANGESTIVLSTLFPGN